ncbi:DUF1996 domain-containing protein [Piscinibacter sp. XHJ-5]|uniref:DUF1996 domain-containing protein n=1 Tax=Piscinibacter sp. XHJ-5 TaxID=3037797 RepID=UPI00245297B1|nr:DUF1996 domain-containing protein [Piscinibacter sp. XHJ-5]
MTMPHLSDNALPFRFTFCLLAAAILTACGGGTSADPSTDVQAEEAVQAGDTAAGFGDSEISTDNVIAAAEAATPTAEALGATAVAGVSMDALAVSVDVALAPARALGVSSDRVKTTGEMPPSTNIGAFRTSCKPSHMAADDPIVYPNQPGRSHLHTFFGNTGTDAYTTADSLANTGNSTCSGGTINRSAYWVPTMIDTATRKPLQPHSAMIYYKTGYNGIRPQDVQPFPEGLRMIAGNAKNATPKGPFQYKCIGKGSEYMVGKTIQNCPVGARLWAVVFFPQCWDGVNLDSPDHKSHMSYTVNRACPKTHPVPLSEITFNIIYDVTEANAPLRWRLSSDNYDRSLPAGYSAHGDWFNGWKQDIMKTFVQKCNQAAKDCHAHLLGDGRAIF